MKTTQQRISEIKSEGYDMDFNNTFTTAFDTYKQIALQGGLAYMLFVIVIIAVVFTIVILSVGLTDFGREMTGFRPDNLSIVNQAFYILGFSVISGLGYPFGAGLIKMAYAADVNEDFSVGTAFSYYKSAKFLDIFICGFLISILVMIINTGLTMAIGTTWGPFVALLPNIIMGWFTVLSLPLIFIGDLKPVDAILVSFAVVAKKPFLVVALLIIAYILACVGFIGLCIGIFFTLPFTSATFYSIYKHSVGVDDNSEMDEIGIESL